MSSTSFSDLITAGGFNQKTIKVDLFVKVNQVYPRQNRLGKTLEHSRRQLTKIHAQRLTFGAGRPSGTTYQCLLRMMVLHRLKDRIYAIYSSRFDPRVQN